MNRALNEKLEECRHLLDEADGDWHSPIASYISKADAEALFARLAKERKKIEQWVNLLDKPVLDFLMGTVRAAAAQAEKDALKKAATVLADIGLKMAPEDVIGTPSVKVEPTLSRPYNPDWVRQFSHAFFLWKRTQD